MPLDWSGDWILANAGRSGLYLVSSDGTRERRISVRPATERSGHSFTKDGRHVLMLLAPGVDGSDGWQLAAIDVATGIERRVSNVDLPSSVRFVRGLSLHPDGKRFLTSVPNFRYDIWMLEGFEDQ